MPELKKIAIDLLRPGPYQPRREFDKDKLSELAQSIKTSSGAIEPIVVKSNDEQNGYLIIAGERRWRATQIAGFDSIECVVRDGLSEADYYFMSLAENVQRTDLNPIEEADQFVKLSEIFSITQADLAEKIGKSRVYVTNKMRLLKLPQVIQEHIKKGELSEGHGKALLKSEGWQLLSVAQQAVKYDWSVRKLEQVIAGVFPDKKTKANDVDIKAHAWELTQLLGNEVHLNYSEESGKGKMTVNFYSLEELEGIVDRIKRRAG